MVTLVTRGIIFPLFVRCQDPPLYRKIGTGCDLHRTKVLNSTDQAVLRHMSVFVTFVLGNIDCYLLIQTNVKLRLLGFKNCN